MRIHFKALQSALINEQNIYRLENNEMTGNNNENLDELSLNIIKALKRDPRATQKMLAEQLNISVSSIQRIMAKLRKIGYIIRAGGKSDGYWIINYK